MSDPIDRQAVMKEFADFVRQSNNSDFARTPTWNDAVSLVESTPSVEPEIIKCKDCMHNGSYDTDCPIDWNGKEYCNFAER